jgi:hypothetical protein
MHMMTCLDQFLLTNAASMTSSCTVKKSERNLEKVFFFKKRRSGWIGNGPDVNRTHALLVAMCHHNESTFFFSGMSYTTDLNSNHPYEYKYVHPNLISTSKILNRLDLEIHKIGQKTSHYRWGRRLPFKE